jgi:RIO-like serine/threonine protein kinase
MNDSLAEKIGRYAAARQLRITRKLGVGNQGLVYAAIQHGAVNEFAVKFHKDSGFSTRRRCLKTDGQRLRT